MSKAISEVRRSDRLFYTGGVCLVVLLLSLFPVVFTVAVRLAVPAPYEPVLAGFNAWLWLALVITLIGVIPHGLYALIADQPGIHSFRGVVGWGTVDVYTSMFVYGFLGLLSLIFGVAGLGVAFQDPTTAGIIQSIAVVGILVSGVGWLCLSAGCIAMYAEVSSAMASRNTDEPQQDSNPPADQPNPESDS